MPASRVLPTGERRADAAPFSGGFPLGTSPPDSLCSDSLCSDGFWSDSFWSDSFCCDSFCCDAFFPDCFSPVPLSRRLSRLARNRHVLSLAGRGLTAACGVLTFFLLARVLGPGGLGAWILYLATGTFVHMCRRGLVKTGLVRALAGMPAGERAPVLGAGWALALLLTGLAAAGVGAGSALFPVPAGFDLFAAWFPVLVGATLPVHVATWIAEADDRFDRVFVLNALQGLLFPLLLVGRTAWTVFTGEPAALSVAGIWAAARSAVTIQTAAFLHVLALGGASALALSLGWARLGSLSRAGRDAFWDLVQFGRYSVGTLLGTHLLTRSDTYLLGVLVGPTAVGVYGVAQKAVRLVLVPLQAFSATAYPSLVRHTEASAAAVSRYAHRWTLLLTLGLIPVLVVLAVGAETVVTCLGGPSYAGSAPVLQWFVLYLALAPADRMIGMLFDSIGTPQRNLMKVGVMIAVNVAGDAAVLLAGGSVAGVAAVTTLTMTAGLVAGDRLLPPSLRFRVRRFRAAAGRLRTRVHRAAAPAD